jgi:hypothetical protein
MDVPVYCSDPMPFSTLLPSSTRSLLAPRITKPPTRNPGAVKI